MSDRAEGPWSIEDIPKDVVMAHEAVWTVLTDSANHFGAYALRVAQHGQDAYEPGVLMIAFTPEMVKDLILQFVEETRPYAQRLAGAS